jgi:HTH-type transcriptional regulator / antitoxin HipB
MPRRDMNIATVPQVQALVRGRRKELNLSQESLARTAGISRKWLSEFERGATTAVELPLVLRVLGALELVVEITAAHLSSSDVAVEGEGSADLDLDDILSDYRSRGLS